VVDEQLRLRRLMPEDAEWRQHPLGLEVVVGPLRAGAAVAAAGERADWHGRLAVQRQPQRLPLRRRLPVDLMDVGEDGVGLLDFFWGRHLATLRSRKPRALSLAPMVVALGNSSSV